MCGWCTWRGIVPRNRASNHDQPATGAMYSSHKNLGSIMVVHPSHPLVGTTLPVVRRYRHRGVSQWVIELPDGGRQYVPASWCMPVGTWAGSKSTVGIPTEGSPLPESGVPVLSLSALRDLAALVRHLKEAHASREGAQQDAAQSADATEERRQGRARRTRRAPRHRRAPLMGELCGDGAPSGGPPADRGGSPTGAGSTAFGLPDGAGEGGAP